VPTFFLPDHDRGMRLPALALFTWFDVFPLLTLFFGSRYVNSFFLALTYLTGMPVGNLLTP